MKQLLNIYKIACSTQKILLNLSIESGADTGIHSEGMRNFEKGKLYKKREKGNFLFKLSF